MNDLIANVTRAARPCAVTRAARPCYLRTRANRPCYVWRLRVSAVILLCLSLTLQGCRKDIPPKPAAYYGPTESISQVIAEINRNNRTITSLWAAHDFEADIIDEHGIKNFVNGDGTLMYSRPDSLRLLGDKPVVGRVFDIGANADRYWLLLPEQVRTMWWGWFRNVGQPCVQNLPIRPDLILEVLGINEFSPNLLAEPVPVMRFNNDADAYMFVWVYNIGDRVIAQKEIWYNRTTKLPSLVLLFDDDGRIILRAYLSDHLPIDIPNLAKEDLPKIATRYRLFFPDSQSKLTFTLRNPALSKRGFPKPASFAFPENPNIPQENVIQIDADCKD